MIYTLNENCPSVTGTAHIDNCTDGFLTESEMLMQYKIRRKFVLNGIDVWITANTEQEYADKIIALSKQQAQQQAQQYKPFSVHRFEDYARKWFAVFSKPNVTRTTAITYERQLERYILPALGSMMIEDVTPSDAQRVFNQMPISTKQATKQKTKIVLNQIFNMAIDDGFIQRNPLHSSAVKIKGAAATPTAPYTVEQMRYLTSHLNDLENPTDRAWLAICVSLPLRPEEVLGLLWEDVDVDNMLFHIRNTIVHPSRNDPEFKPYTKTQASVRDLSVSQWLIDQLPLRGNQKEFVIGGSAPLSYTQLCRMRKRIQKQTGFTETITPRRFRTTVATDISAMTHDLKLVQKMLGHSTPQMTLKHYDKGRATSIDATNAIEQCYRA